MECVLAFFVLHIRKTLAAGLLNKINFSLFKDLTKMSSFTRINSFWLNFVSKRKKRQITYLSRTSQLFSSDRNCTFPIHDIDELGPGLFWFVPYLYQVCSLKSEFSVLSNYWREFRAQFD